MRIVADPSTPSPDSEPSTEAFSLRQDQRIAQFIESAPMVGDGAVSEADIQALTEIPGDLLRLAALAGATGSSVLQGIALVYESSSTLSREDRIASLFNLAAALGYGGSYSLAELAKWVDAQIVYHEAHPDQSGR